MAVNRAIIRDIEDGGFPDFAVTVYYSDGSSILGDATLNFSVPAISSTDSFRAAAEAVINTNAAGQGYTLSLGIIWEALSTAQISALITAAIAAIPAPSAPVASALSLSLQTSTGAVGTQVSSTKSAYVMLNGSVSTTATIGGSSAGDIILEVAPTNSATAGDWVEWGRIGNSQTISLALALNSVQVTKGMAVAFVPAGYYVKARQAGSGTVSYALTNAKQILV